MNLIGQPFVIQNTNGLDWLVTWDRAISSDDGEQVSFTVAIPRRADPTIQAAQRLALERAVYLLQQALAAMP